MKFSALISGELTENSLHMLSHHATRNAMIRKLWRDLTTEDSNMFLQFEASIRSLIWEGKTVTLREFPANSKILLGLATTSERVHSFGLINAPERTDRGFALDRFVNRLYNTVDVRYEIRTRDFSSDDLRDVLMNDEAVKMCPWGIYNSTCDEYDRVEFV